MGKSKKGFKGNYGSLIVFSEPILKTVLLQRIDLAFYASLVSGIVFRWGDPGCALMQPHTCACNMCTISIFVIDWHFGPVPSPWGAFGGLAPHAKLQAPKIETRNTMNQLSFCQFLVSSPPAQTQSPPRRNAKPPYWKLSGDGSVSGGLIITAHTSPILFCPLGRWRMGTWREHCPLPFQNGVNGGGGAFS